MPKKGDAEITIPTYQRHQVFETEQEVEIVIVHGEHGNENITKIKCKKNGHQHG
jgi:hypothetical protein